MTFGKGEPSALTKEGCVLGFVGLGKEAAPELCGVSFFDSSKSVFSALGFVSFTAATVLL